MSTESESWYRIDEPIFNSGFENEEFWRYSHGGFKEVLDSFAGQTVKIYDKSMEKPPISVRAILQNKTSDVYNSTVNRQILCEIGILHCGQYVEERNGSVWMVSALPDNNRVYEKAVLWKCKHTIHFRSTITGEIVNYPVYSINSTQYGTGEHGKENITVGDAAHLMYVPMNEETILIDDNFRFLIDKNKDNPTAYRITQVDPLSYAVGEEYEEDGILQWTIEETVFNERTDSKEYMVADYYVYTDEQNEEDIETGIISLVSDDGNTSITIGESKTISVFGGFENVSFSLIGADGIAEIENQSDSMVTLNTFNKYENVGKKVTLVAYSGDSEDSIVLTVNGW